MCECTVHTIDTTIIFYTLGTTWIFNFFLHIFTKVSKFQWDMHRHRADHRCDIRMRLSVAVLRLARLAVGALVAVAVGQGHLAAVAVGVLVVVVVVVVGLGHAELAVGVLVGVVV